ncbi:methyl-accepting chemotaxis protein [Edwardsiella piscicida]
MNQRITVRGGLLVIIVTYTLLLFFISSMGIYFLRQSNHSLAVVNQLQADELGPLSTGFSSTLRARSAAAVAARQLTLEHIADADSSRRTVEALLTESNDIMAQFSALKKVTVEGQRLSARLEQSYNAYIQDGLQPMVQALAARNLDTYYALLENQVSSHSTEYDRDLREFRQFADTLGRQALEKAQRDYQRAMTLIISACVLLLAVGGFCWYALRGIILRPLAQLDEQVEHIAAGDLARQLALSGRSEIAQLGRQLTQMQQALAGTVRRVRDASEQVDVGARELRAGNRDLSQRTEELAASLEETAASMEQLTATVRQNAANAEQANLLASGVSDSANQGAGIVNEAIVGMRSISHSSQKIADIISVIDGIAFQTNILALNAAVEAARAGEQGRGFAVVAGEVRNLAQRSAQSAKEIKLLIEDSVRQVSDGERRVSAAAETMAKISAEVVRVTALMSEISGASQEQTRGIEQVNQAIAQMDQVAQQNAALVEESTAATASLEAQSEQLMQSMESFKLA